MKQEYKRAIIKGISIDPDEGCIIWDDQVKQQLIIQSPAWTGKVYFIPRHKIRVIAKGRR